MKKIFIIITVLAVPFNVQAECVANAKTYTSCNPGYSLSLGTCSACAIGYYKSTTGTAISCYRCPASNGIYGTTLSTASTSITDCYIPSDSTWTFSDTTGSGEEGFTTNCYYTN